MHIYFHSLLWSYQRILTILTTCVYSNKIYNLCIMTMYLEFELTTFLSGLLVLRISQLLSSSCLLDWRAGGNWAISASEETPPGGNDANAHSLLSLACLFWKNTHYFSISKMDSESPFWTLRPPNSYWPFFFVLKWYYIVLIQTRLD